MRVGENPQRNKKIIDGTHFHQVVMPIFIPNHIGYYKDSFRILKLSINSLLKTKHSNTFITLVNNGSCIEVVDYINSLFRRKKIHEVIHTSNIGKINSVIKAVKGYKFSLITIVDADVLFLNGWQEETYKVFKSFKKVGSVCTTPSSRSLMSNTFNIYFDLMFSKKIKFTKVVNKEALLAFARSVGNNNFYKSVHLNKILTVKNKENYAVIGSGHYIATYRSDIIYNNKSNSYKYFLGGNTVQEYLDVPVIRKGYWRLSTQDNYSYHLGNVYEDWMDKVFNEILQEEKKYSTFDLAKEKNQTYLGYYIKNVFFKKILLRKPIKNFFLKIKGLTSYEYKEY